MRLLLAHGWGFDAGFWTPLRAALDVPTEADERGYFGAPATPGIVGAHVAVGHSLGALRLLLAPPAGCVGIVAVNGFDRFCGPAGVAARIVDRMLARLDAAPAETVRDFRARCGDDSGFVAPYPLSLRADLVLLRDGNARGRPRPPLLALDGGADPILAPAHRAACFAGARRETRAGGSHLLPRTDPGWCAARIADFLATL